MKDDRPEQHPDFTFATDLGTNQKIFAGAPATRPAIDLGDFDQVVDLAWDTFLASDRLVMKLTVAEIRALAGVAIQGAVIASRVAQLVRLVDRQDRDKVMAELDELDALMRPMLRVP